MRARDGDMGEKNERVPLDFLSSFPVFSCKFCISRMHETQINVCITFWILMMRYIHAREYEQNMHSRTFVPWIVKVFAIRSFFFLIASANIQYNDFSWTCSAEVQMASYGANYYTCLENRKA